MHGVNKSVRIPDSVEEPVPNLVKDNSQNPSPPPQGPDLFVGEPVRRVNPDKVTDPTIPPFDDRSFYLTQVRRDTANHKALSRRIQDNLKAIANLSADAAGSTLDPETRGKEIVRLKQENDGHQATIDKIEERRPYLKLDRARSTLAAAETRRTESSTFAGFLDNINKQNLAKNREQLTKMNGLAADPERTPPVANRLRAQIGILEAKIVVQEAEARQKSE